MKNKTFVCKLISYKHLVGGEEAIPGVESIVMSENLSVLEHIEKLRFLDDSEVYILWLQQRNAAKFISASYTDGKDVWILKFDFINKAEFNTILLMYTEYSYKGPPHCYASQCAFQNTHIFALFPKMLGLSLLLPFH